MSNEWIDIHDKLPEPYEEVLICRYNSQLKFNSIGIDQLVKVYSKVFWEDFSENYKEPVWRITHWMPIPPPPKKGIVEIAKEGKIKFETDDLYEKYCILAKKYNEMVSYLGGLITLIEEAKRGADNAE